MLYGTPQSSESSGSGELTQEEKKAAEEEARLAQEEAKKKQQEEEEARRAEEEAAKVGEHIEVDAGVFVVEGGEVGDVAEGVVLAAAGGAKNVEFRMLNVEF